MQQILRDTAGLGALFWLAGYLAGIILFFTPLAPVMGWVMTLIFTPVTLAVTWWWFRSREDHSLQYYAVVGMAWMLIAVVLDYLFIVMLLHPAAYYSLHVFVYYVLMFIIPVGVGMYLGRAGVRGI